MAFPVLGAVLGGLGAIAGGLGQQARSGVRLAPEGQSERMGRELLARQLPGLESLVGAGPGMEQVTAANQSNSQLAAMLQQFIGGGFLPNQQDFATANQFASSALAPQQVAINQQFQEEQQRANQLAAQLGRPVNDPIIQARLSQERMRAQERLGASQSAMASEFALSLPQQRLGYAGQLADFQNQLSAQAMQNRQTIASLGSNLQQAGMAFRQGTAERYQTQGGGLAGAISGGIAGFGAGMGISNMFGGGFSNPMASAPVGQSAGYLGNYSFGAPAMPSVNFGQSGYFGQLGQSRISQQAAAPAVQIGSSGFPMFARQAPTPQPNIFQMLQPSFGGR